MNCFLNPIPRNIACGQVKAELIGSLRESRAVFRAQMNGTVDT